MMSASTCDLAIHQLTSEFPTTGHVMPGFQENLVGVGPRCDTNCTVTFTKIQLISTVLLVSPSLQVAVKLLDLLSGACL